MQQWQIAFRVIGIGWYMAFAVLAGVFGGFWLDGKLGTKPAFLVTGLILGLIVAGRGAYQMFKPFMNNQVKGE